MKTVQESITSIIKKTPFLEEALNDKLINISALARMMKDRVEKDLGRSVKEGALMMAINRLSPYKLISVRREIEKISFSISDFVVRSNLFEITLRNTATLMLSTSKLIQGMAQDADVVLTISQGVFETTLVASKSLRSLMNEAFKDEIILYQQENLASVTIKLPRTNLEHSGVYYLILKQLAWSSIPVREIISTTHEMTLVIREEDISRTFEVLNTLKKK